MSELLSQQFLFQHIKQLLPETVSLSDTIASILYLSPDSVYRRIRCETPLTLDETKSLCEHFHISVDQLFRLNNNSVLFQNHRVDARNYTFEKFLSGLQQQLNFIQQFKDKEVIYLTKDVPLFHSFYYDPLFAFRYFFWMKSIIFHPEFDKAVFSLDCLPAHIADAGLKLCKTYNELPSAEIWNTECVNSIIAQVEFYYEAGYIKSAKTVNIIYDAALATLVHLQHQAEAGSKFALSENHENKSRNFRLFHNTTVLGDNTILVKTGNSNTVFLNYDVLNYMHTSDEIFCGQINNMLQNLMHRSTLISSENEKQRFRFFNILADKIRSRKKNS